MLIACQAHECLRPMRCNGFGRAEGPRTRHREREAVRATANRRWEKKSLRIVDHHPSRISEGDARVYCRQVTESRMQRQIR